MSTVDDPAVNRTFYPRRGRVSKRHEDALTRLYPLYGVPRADTEPVDPASLYGRTAPLVVEIGSGMGETTLRMALADPERDYLAIEVHPPGIGNLLAGIEETGARNLRVFDGDALRFLAARIEPDSLDAILVFFPDPWPKARHHKRRLITTERAALLRSRLRVGGTLHCATDWAEYAESMLTTLTADEGLTNAHDGFAPRPAYRPPTKFERRGIEAGRRIFDLVFTKV